MISKWTWFFVIMIRFVYTDGDNSVGTCRCVLMSTKFSRRGLSMQAHLLSQKEHDNLTCSYLGVRGLMGTTIVLGESRDRTVMAKLSVPMLAPPNSPFGVIHSTAAVKFVS